MPSADDLLLVRLALANRMVTQEQVDECMEAEGPPGEGLGERLVRRGYLRPEALALLGRIQGRAPATTGAAPMATGPAPSTGAVTVVPGPAPSGPPAAKGKDTRGLPASPTPPPIPVPAPLAASVAPEEDREGDVARVIRARGLVPEDLLAEARGLAATLPPDPSRPGLVRACIQKAFLTPFQADEVMESLRGGGYRCEGCGAGLAAVPGAGARCPECDLALPMPGVPIDPDGPTAGAVLGRVVVVCGTNRGYVYVVREKAKLTVGRKSANKLRLFDPVASRAHCVIGAEGTGLRLEDADSRSGTFVNGVPLRRHDLRGGDLVRIGGTVLEYRAELAPTTRKPPVRAAPVVPEEEIDDLLFGRIAVKLGVLSRRDLEIGLAAQEASEPRPIGKILLERGTLSDEGLLKVLALQKRNLSRRGHYTSQTREAMLFGRLALREGFVRETQLNECLRTQGREEEASAARRRLGEVMAARKLLTADQVAHILKLQGKTGGGPRIEGYDLEEKLGEGGMGAVFRARQLSLDRVVAIKLLSPRLVAEPGYVDRFMREARAAGRLNHQNIVRAIDVGRVGGLYYFVMEYIDGETAADRLKRDGPFPEAEAMRVAVEVGKALAHAAEHSLVHRDVKPDNLMLSRDGSVKLCDLGLARGTGADPGVTASNAGEIVGTPNYVSPEQAKGLESIDIRSDLYSLGATLYHLVTGQLPFKGESAAVVVMARHITDQLPSPREFVGISEEFHLVLAHCLVKDRRRRYQHPKELLEDLAAMARGEDPRHARASTGRSTVRRH